MWDSLSNSLLLAWRYVTYHRFQSAVLVACLTLSACLPVATQLLLTDFEQRLTARAESTPLVVGAPGSRFDLALHALYFEAPVTAPLSMREVDTIREGGLATPIPLDVEYTAGNGDFPVVGTTLEYFDFRGLKLDDGKPLARLGDCVLGARAAKELDRGPGDRLLTDPENVFDIAGTYPLRMRIRGVFAETGTADDYAVFVDVKTAWVIAGIGHGHEDLQETEQRSAIRSRSDSRVVANAALMQYREVTDENVGSFHFHGEPQDLPVTAVIAVPEGADPESRRKAESLLKGRYQSRAKEAQILAPQTTIAELMDMVFEVKRLYDANTLLVGVATGLFLVLIVLLSRRLRARENETMFKIGCSRGKLLQLQACELALLFAFAALLVGAFSLLALTYAPQLMRVLLF